VSAFVGGGRSRAQCSQRWVRGLDPRISKGQWSAQQEERLVEIVRTRGSHMWSQIAAELGNRSDVQCRYHFFQMYREGRLPFDVAAMAGAERPAERPRVLPGSPTPIMLRRVDPPPLPVAARSASVGQMSLPRPTGPGFEFAASAERKQKSRRGSLPTQQELALRSEATASHGGDSDGEIQRMGGCPAPQGSSEFLDWGIEQGETKTNPLWAWW
jgi:hypothetical protein